MRNLFAGLATALLITLAGVGNSVHAQDESDLLPVEQAFKLSAHADGAGKLALHWDIAQDYYLYRSRIKAKSTQAGVTLGALDLPPGEQKHDEFLGEVEVYHHSIDATLPYSLADATTKNVSVTLTVQGCHETDPKICYPPSPTTVSVDVAATGATVQTPSPPNPPLEGEGLKGGAGLGIQLGTGASSGLPGTDASPLPPEQAFVFEAIAQSPGTILARWTMPKNYYLYRDKSTVTLSDGNGVTLGAPQWPTGVDHTDEHFGMVKVYFDQVELPITLLREQGTAQAVKLHAEYQGCLENGICYPVMQKDVTVELPAASLEQLAAAKAAFVPAPGSIAASAAAGTSAAMPTASAGQPSSPSPPPSLAGILGALLGALLGGLVLNLMPCVLPVLSLKVLGLAQSGESAEKARKHALVYTAGVLVAFAAVGLAVVGLRAAGQALGWGFQLQQPVFVAVLVYVLFAIGLSLSGVFNIGAGLAGVGQNLGNRSGAAGDFFTGVLAVVVASPCTAPFMGSALAYAFSSSSLVALLVFLALGVGLALPFLLIGFVPALAARLPRPGAWMETLKQLFAFPMYLTAVWLVWVLGNQRGIDAVGWVLIGAVVLALGLWWWERSRYRDGVFARAFALLIVLGAALPLWQVAHLATLKAAQAANADTVAYSAERLAALRAEGRGVFVDVGADWCVTCKVNEKAVLDTDTFRALLKRNNAVFMVADWTNVDPAITAFLQQYKAVGVPLYVVFRAGETGPGQALPTVLTDAIVAGAFTPTGR